MTRDLQTTLLFCISLALSYFMRPRRLRRLGGGALLGHSPIDVHLGVQGSPCRGLGCPQLLLSPSHARRRRASKSKEKGFFGGLPRAPGRRATALLHLPREATSLRERLWGTAPDPRQEAGRPLPPRLPMMLDGAEHCASQCTRQLHIFTCIQI